MNNIQILCMDAAGETGEVIFRTPCSVGSGEVGRTELEKKLLECLGNLVCYDSYSTEYDGRMIDVCPSCGTQDGGHSEFCEFVEAKALIAAATEGAV